MNQGTFSDYHSIHNWSGVASPAYVFNGSWIASNIVGMYASDIYSYGDGSTSDYTVCSRLSWFSTLTTFSDYHSVYDLTGIVCIGGSGDKYSIVGSYLDNITKDDSWLNTGSRLSKVPWFSALTTNTYYHDASPSASADYMIGPCSTHFESVYRKAGAFVSSYYEFGTRSGCWGSPQ